MKAKFINEKFTEDSDAIQDMGIGYVHKIERHTLNNNMPGLSNSDEAAIDNFFNTSMDKLYYIGSDSILKDIDKDIPHYFAKVKSLFRTTPIYEKKYVDSYGSNVFKGWNTQFGKVATLWTDGVTYYIGDIKIAAKINVDQITNFRTYINNRRR